MLRNVYMVVPFFRSTSGQAKCQLPLRWPFAQNRSPFSNHWAQARKRHCFAASLKSSPCTSAVSSSSVGITAYSTWINSNQAEPGSGSTNHYREKIYVFFIMKGNMWNMLISDQFPGGWQSEITDQHFDRTVSLGPFLSLGQWESCHQTPAMLMLPGGGQRCKDVPTGPKGVLSISSHIYGANGESKAFTFLFGPGFRGLAESFWR